MSLCRMNGLEIVAMIFLLFVNGSVSKGQVAPEQMDLYLLIGQSNMAGRGEITVDTSAGSRNIWVINKQHEWVPAKDPLHYDKPSAGVGPGLAFAEEIQKKYPERPIGLIPCAVGGSSIADWNPGKKHEGTGIYAYDAMLARVKAAQKDGKIKGILWHQGESDSSPEKVVLYEEKLSTFFAKLRKEIGAKKVPLILGTLGDFYVEKKPEAAKINQVMEDYAGKTKNVYLISSAGLKDTGDDTHFNADAARELGRRYAAKMIENFR